MERELNTQIGKKLGVLAVAAPHWPKKPPNCNTDAHLNSRTPFSLQNAIRGAVQAAKQNISPWGDSNWKDSCSLSDSVYLSDYLSDTLEWLDTRLDGIDLVFIGAMSISMRGAIEIARFIKQKDKGIFIVLGGKHVLETMFMDRDADFKVMESCPLFHIKEGNIERLFDVVISGDGESVVNILGEIVYESKVNVRVQFDHIYKILSDTDMFYGYYYQRLKGEVLIAWVDDSFNYQYIYKKSTSNPGQFSFPIEHFDIVANFPVFDAERTVHLYSYSSKGCIYSCSFCSEGSHITGKVTLDDAAVRLYQQMEIAVNRSKDELNGMKMSAFIEDSILLQGNLRQLEILAELLENNPINIRFGGQLTIDIALKKSHQEVYRRLSKLGLCYIFVGLESSDEKIASSLSKNTFSASKSRLNNIAVNAGPSWMERSESVLQGFNEIDIKVGFSLLFGLGESHETRINLLTTLQKWQEVYDNLLCISLNWAVMHPLKGLNSAGYAYLDWPIDPNDLRYEIITRIFGEASTTYCMHGVSMASKKQLEEIEYHYMRLKNII